MAGRKNLSNNASFTHKKHTIYQRHFISALLLSYSDEDIAYTRKGLPYQRSNVFILFHTILCLEGQECYIKTRRYLKNNVNIITIWFLIWILPQSQENSLFQTKYRGKVVARTKCRQIKCRSHNVVDKITQN